MFDRPEWPAIYQQQAARGILPQLRSLPAPVRGVEVGVNRGLNSWFMIKECANIEKLTGVDHYMPYLDWDRPISKSEQENSYQIMQANMAFMNGKFEHLRMESAEAAATFADESLDFVFIDGGHSMKQVLKDLDNWVRKVRVGGLVAGHDANLFSVNFALTSWTKRQSIGKDQLKMTENDGWYWYKT